MSREKWYAWPTIIAIGVIFIASNILWLFPFMRDTEQASARYQTEVARRVALRADFFLEKKLREMGALALDLLEVDADPKKTDAIIAKFLARHADFISVNLKSLLAGADEYSVSPVSFVDGRKIITVVASLPYTSLMLVTRIAVGEVITEMANERVGIKGRVYATDAAYNIVFHEYEGVTHIDGTGNRAFMTQDGGTGRYINEANTQVLGAAVMAPSIGWTIVVEVPLTEAWANKYNAITLAVFLMLMGLVFVIILIINFRKIMAIATREEGLHKAKAEYISLLAHQLRTPLAGTKWNLKTLLDGDWGKMNEKQKRFLSRSYETNEHMIRLVGDLLNITRIEEGRYDFTLKKTDIRALVHRVADSFKGQAKDAGIRLVIKKPRAKAHIPLISMDAEKMAMALGNLIDNAIRYNKPKGLVEVAFTREVRLVRITVKDTGVGIPARQQSKLFERFFRGDNVVTMQVQGFGLGLFITKNIIERHGGTIKVESKENEGTVFTVTVPIR